MAAVQRKLVHKQFNSPMGLYSQENVKATLNRELKAFGGEGIEVDDQISKPLNLANSAVLRAVEEEEQQVKCDFYANKRQSRSRQREGDAQHPHHALHQQLLDQIKTQYLSHQQDITIDRDTVLKINRMATKRSLLKRDHSWPPLEAETSNGNVTNSNPNTSQPNPMHSIELLREKFNSPTRIVEPTAKQVREQRQREGRPTATATTPNTASMKSVDHIFHPTPMAKGFSAPETRAADVDLGLVAPRCEYYEQLAQKRPGTPPTLTTPTPYRPRPKRQSYSLDRGRSRKRAVALGNGAPELPPPKPRPARPKVQRRCIKLATELKISYDNDGNDSNDEEQPKVDVDLEAIPLPPTPTPAAAAASPKSLETPPGERLPKKVPSTTIIDSLAVKKQQQMALALAHSGGGATARIIPVRVETSSDPGQQLSAQQIYDEACNYLQDQEQEMSNAQDMANATFVSAASGIKLQQPGAKSIPTPPPLPPPPSPPQHQPLPQMRAKSTATDDVSRRQGRIYSQSKCETETAKEKQHEAHVEIAQLEAKYAHIQQSIAEHLRQIDAYMENAKNALQRSVQSTPTSTPTPPSVAAAAGAPPPPPPPPTPPQSTAAAAAATETPKPLTKANNELWDMFASRQSPILAVESPLQAILRQIYCRAGGLTGGVCKQEQTNISDMVSEQVSVAENVPIVERALEDLHRIAVALDDASVLHVEHKTTPAADEAQHVVIEEELDEDNKNAPIDVEYRHVSDVIANYEQLSTGKSTLTPRLDTEEMPEKQEPQSEGEHKHEAAGEAEGESESESCSHEPHTCCSICGELRNSPNWSKLSKADQWRIANLRNESLENYKATYEIRSPYISRQISWEETQTVAPKTETQTPTAQKAPSTPPPADQKREKMQRQRSFVEIITTPIEPSIDNLALSNDAIQWQRSRSPSPLPSRKYPAPLIEAPQRASSPFGLNPVHRSKSPTAPAEKLEAKFTHIPQLEGQNIGLLVHTATEPLQQSMSASSSMLAGPITPRSLTNQPSPFIFPSLKQSCMAKEQEEEEVEVESEVEVERQHQFKSLASTNEELQQSTREFNFNRSFDNVSPRPYIAIEGYKRVAWPPASEERIIREFTPQPQSQSPAPGSGGYYPQQQAAAAVPVAPAATAPPSVQPPQHQQQQQPPQQQPPQQQQYGAPSYNNYQQQPQQQQQQQHAAPVPQWQQQPPQQQYQAPYQAPAQQSVPQWAHQQPAYQASPYQQQQQAPPQQYPQQNGGSNYAQPQYNSYSQPQHQPYSQDQTDLQQQQSVPYAGQDSYRGASPGIITLRKEAPVSQQPAPVYTSQPAAVSYQGGSKLRGDLKWPPPEYKEAAARENEERRQLALGPVCRPRRINRDYTNFFAQHQLNNAYPSYKVPPGTQHMFA
ncbi:uncharacterized protein LOC6645216 isoform X3 [Drosophila willistoni]|uniref:uncharacterized protein LOC6645216 isoform X3 n=1 Tax=Drosophila willistoni TaxID=7260 RepID=UPI000C26CEEA|nr:uncharacterized protein LOC6645216 isoform X3 [Drosophila willistoni]